MLIIWIDKYVNLIFPTMMHQISDYIFTIVLSCICYSNPLSKSILSFQISTNSDDTMLLWIVGINFKSTCGKQWFRIRFCLISGIVTYTNHISKHPSSRHFSSCSRTSDDHWPIVVAISSEQNHVVRSF